MNFTLMDEKFGRVRRANAEEMTAIHSYFPQCTGYRISTPYLILECPKPPRCSPIAVGGLLTIYTKNMGKYVETWGRLGNPRVKDFRSKSSRLTIFAFLNSKRFAML